MLLPSPRAKSGCCSVNKREKREAPEVVKERGLARVRS